MPAGIWRRRIEALAARDCKNGDIVIGALCELTARAYRRGLGIDGLHYKTGDVVRHTPGLTREQVLRALGKLANGNRSQGTPGGLVVIRRRPGRGLYWRLDAGVIRSLREDWEQEQ